MTALRYVSGVVIMCCSMLACTTTPEKGQVANLCKDPRPQICTMIYMPVCGLDDNNDFNTYASGCNACSRSEVLGYNEGACEDLVLEKAQ